MTVNDPCENKTVRDRMNRILVTGCLFGDEKCLKTTEEKP